MVVDPVQDQLRTTNTSDLNGVVEDSYFSMSAIPEFSQELTRDEVYETLARLGNIYSSRGLLSDQKIYLKTVDGNWKEFTSQGRTDIRYEDEREKTTLRYSTLYSLLGTLAYWFQNHGYNKLKEFSQQDSWRSYLQKDGRPKDGAISELFLAQSTFLDDMFVRLYRAAVRKEKTDSGVPEVKGEKLFPKTDFVLAFAYAINISEQEEEAAELAATTPTSHDAGSGDDSSSQAVVTDLPTTPESDQATAPTDDETSVSLTRSERGRKVRYEVSWLYNRALHDLFYSNGIQLDQIPADLRNQLLGEALQIANSQSDDALALIFASPSKRQALLNQLYSRLRSSPYLVQLNAFYTQKLNETTDDSEREELRAKIDQNAQKVTGGKTFISEKGVDAQEEILEMSIQEILKSDNPAVIRNIQQTIDTLVINYGVNSAIPNEEERAFRMKENPADALWFINTLSKGKISLIFQIEKDLTSREVGQLKAMLSDFAQVRATELQLQSRSVGIVYGAFKMGRKEVEKIKRNDTNAFRQQVKVINDVRQLVSQEGSQVVAAAIEHKKDAESIKKQFRIFLPLWNSLSDDEKKYVYRTFDIPYATSGAQTSLPMVEQFMLFQLTDLERFRALTATEKKSILSGKISFRQLSAQSISRIESKLAEIQKLSLTPPTGTALALKKLSAIQLEIDRLQQNSQSGDAAILQLRRTIAQAKQQIENEHNVADIYRRLSEIQKLSLKPPVGTAVALERLTELQRELSQLIGGTLTPSPTVEKLRQNLLVAHAQVSRGHVIHQQYAQFEQQSVATIKVLEEQLATLSKERPAARQFLQQLQTQVSQVGRDVTQITNQEVKPLAVQTEAIVSLAALKSQLKTHIHTQAPTNAQLRAIEQAIEQIETALRREQQQLKLIEAGRADPSFVTSVSSSAALSIIEQSLAIEGLTRLRQQLSTIASIESQERATVMQVQQDIAQIESNLNSLRSTIRQQFSPLEELSDEQIVLLELAKAHEKERRSLVVAALLSEGVFEAMSQEQMHAIAEYVGIEQGRLRSELSVSEISEAADYLENDYDPEEIDVNDEETTSGDQQRISPRRRRRFFGRRKEPKSLLQQGVQKASNALIRSGANALTPLAAGAIRLSDRLIGEENTNKVIIFGTAALASSTAIALSSTMGKIFGALGGLLGGLAGSSLFAAGAIPGAAFGGVAGAHFGHYVVQPWMDATFGLTPQTTLAGSVGTTGAGAVSAPLGTINPMSAGKVAKLGTGAGTSPLGAGGLESSALPGSTEALQSSLTTPAVQTAGAQVGTGGLGSGVGLGAPATNVYSLLANALNQFSVGVAAPIGALALGFTTYTFVIWVIFAAFLAPIPTDPLNSGVVDLLEGFEGCWPTTGTITGYKTYSNNGEPHATWTGELNGFQGPGTAIDISTGSNFPPVYSPFAGTADFYPDGTGISTAYGTHIVVTTPNFVMIFAHLRDFAGTQTMNSPTLGVSVVAGQLLGTVDSTGNSTGNHLHYEIVGTDVINVLPLSDSFKQAIVNQEDLIFGTPVSSEDCSIQNMGDAAGFMAIGPRTAANLLVSTTAEIEAGAVRTCSWQASKNVEVAINGNFFNTPTEPIGLAGTSPSKYWANADNRSLTLINQMQSLVVDTVTSRVSMVRPDPDLATRDPIEYPIDVPQYRAAVTGLYDSGPSSTSVADDRTLVGLGTANDVCSTEYVGQEVIFFLVMNNVSYDEMEAEAARCGATSFIHLDAGGSTAFCTADPEMTKATTRNVPVNLGMFNAELIKIFPTSP